MPDLGNTSVFSQTDASNNTGTQPSWSGSAAPSTIDDAGRALQGAVFREWNWRSFTVTAGGTANAKTLTYSVAPAALYTGQKFAFIANTANSSTCTLNVNSLGAKTIKKDVAGVLTALSSGDMASGQYVEVTYNGTDFIWTNYQGQTTAASTSTAGVVELATNAEAVAMASSTLAVTPSNLAALLGQGADIAGTGNIFCGDGGYFNITGTSFTCTDVDFTSASLDGRQAVLYFVSAGGVLAHNATTMPLPGAANITVEAGDIMIFWQDATDNVKTAYFRASGRPVVGSTTLATAQASTSGTSIDFTGIPSGVKQVTIMLRGVSTSGTSELLVQIGDSGGIETTGYISTASNQSGGSTDSSTAGFIITDPQVATDVVSGRIVINLLDASANSWVSTGIVKRTTSTMSFSAGDKALSATLDRVRITTVGGTDTFDAGSINIMYE